MNPLIVTLVSILVAAGALDLAFRGAAWIRRRRLGHTREVVVHCRDEASFGGVELRSDSGGILLGAPRSLPDDGPPVPMVGDLWIPATNVRAVQIVPASEAARDPVVGFRTERQARRRA